MDDAPVLTRNDQLSFKSQRKGARKEKGKGKAGKKNKGKGKSGKGKGSKTEKTKKNGKQVNSPKGKVKSVESRRRKILKSASSSKLNLETPSESSGGKGLNGVKKGDKKRKCPKDTVKPAPKAKRGTKDPTAKKAKAVATPKAKAKQNRGKGCGECDEGKRDPNPELTQRLLGLAHHFGPFVSVRDDKFKTGIRSYLELDTLQNCRLNIYWTRCSAGITLLETKSDIQHFSFNSSSCAESYKAAVSIGLAAEVATRIVQFWLNILDKTIYIYPNLNFKPYIVTI